MEGGKYMFRIHRSPMCEYMINFIHKLKHLPEKYMMNSVLENFTILQVCVRVCISCLVATCQTGSNVSQLVLGFLAPFLTNQNQEHKREVK